eukprot:Rmarinus@m.21829
MVDTDAVEKALNDLSDLLRDCSNFKDVEQQLERLKDVVADGLPMDASSVLGQREEKELTCTLYELFPGEVEPRIRTETFPLSDAPVAESEETVELLERSAYEARSLRDLRQDLQQAYASKYFLWSLLFSKHYKFEIYATAEDLYERKQVDDYQSLEGEVYVMIFPSDDVLWGLRELGHDEAYKLRFLDTRSGILVVWHFIKVLENGSPWRSCVMAAALLVWLLTFLGNAYFIHMRRQTAYRKFVRVSKLQFTYDFAMIIVSAETYAVGILNEDDMSTDSIMNILAGLHFFNIFLIWYRFCLPSLVRFARALFSKGF